MLPIPKNDYTSSQVLASWAELSALAEDDGAVFYGTILESMRDSQLYTDESGSLDERDSATAGSSAAMLSDTWAVLAHRRRLLGKAWPFSLSDSKLTRLPGKESIESVAAYAAILIIEAASSKWFPSLAIGAGDPIRTWFEEIVQISACRLLKGLGSRFGTPYPSGWPSGFSNRVKHLASLFQIEAREIDIQQYASSHQQDDSLDIVVRWNLCDEEDGSPFLLFQCATGANWKTHKPGEPAMNLWQRYISWNGPIYKALAVPFTLRDRGELAKASVRHQEAFVFDRLRISAGCPDEEIDDAFRGQLAKWCATKFVQIVQN